MGYSPWGHKELDMTEQLSMHTCTTSVCLIIQRLGHLLQPGKIAGPVLESSPRLTRTGLSPKCHAGGYEQQI